MPPIKAIECPVTPLSREPHSHFFGYYDKSPWDPTGRASGVLAHQTAIHGRMPLPGETLSIGLLDHTGMFNALGESRAWNFQQGCMLQWHPVAADTLLLNDIIDDRAVSIRLNIISGDKATIDRPFASVSPMGDKALSINFGRLTSIKPEYGYAGLADEFEGVPCPGNDGIWVVDLESGESRLLLSVRSIADFKGNDGSKDAYHYINHVMYNRDGSRFCFLHRYINKAGTQNTRLFVCNADGSDLTLLISGMASHFGWKDNNLLLAWAGERNLISSATGGGFLSRLPIGNGLKKIYRAFGKPAAFKSRLLNDRYILFDIANYSKTTIAKDILKTDGHCSFSRSGEWFVTDTYPDRNGVASLLLGRLSDQAVFEVARFQMPPELDNEIRCDLHPRWHPRKPSICVDSADGSGRQMYEVDVSSLLGGRF